MAKKRHRRKAGFYLRIFSQNKLLLSITFIIAVITSAAGAFLALLLKNIIDITTSGDMSRFMRALLINVSYMAVFAVIYFINSLLIKKLMRNVIKRLRDSIFNGIFRRSYQDFYDVNTADYISVLTNDIKMVEDNYIQPLMGIVENMMSFLFTLVILIFVSPIITLLLFIGLILMFLIPGIIGQKLQKKQEILSGRFSAFTSKIKDLFSGFEVFKSFQLLAHAKKQFSAENETLVINKYNADRLFVLNETVSQFLAVFTQIFTIFAGAFLVIRGTITIGTLIAIMQLAGSFVMPLVYIMQNFPKIQSVAPIMKRMEQFTDYSCTSFDGRKEPQFKDKIQVSDLSFSYHEEQPVLKQVNITLEKGKKYAIVGESGCGKTTLVKLLMGYYPNYQGDIYYDGVEMKDCEVEKFSELASMIHQNVYMFDDSINNNICLFQPYSDEQLEKAVKSGGVDKFLPVMQDQLNTIVGENGANLSGGQRQRIAIARALIKATPLLILDEGTSAIDQQTSYDIEYNLLDNKDLTLITVTHRLDEDLLSSYDQIIFMENGEIKETGSYSKLFKAKMGFYNFCVA